MKAKLILAATWVLLATTSNVSHATETEAQAEAVHATEVKEAAYPDDSTVPSIDAAEYYSAEDSSQILKKWTAEDRKIASNQSFSESDMTPSMKSIRDKILASKTAADFDARLAELEANYEKLDDDAKFFAAQMIMMKPLRGVVWRLRPLFEQKSGLFKSFSGNPATHSSAVTILRFVNHATSISVPTAQADALFDFVVSPNKDMRLAQQFKTVGQFQLFLAKEILPATLKASKRVSALFNKSKNIPFVWDNKIMYGPGSFRDGIRRYVGFNEPEIALTNAAMLRAAQGIAIFCAYNQDELINVAGRLAKLYGIDGYSSEVLGVTSAERAKILNSFRSKGFLSLRTPKFMSVAYDLLKLSTSFVANAADLLQAQPASSAVLVNPLFFKSDVQPRLATGVASLQSTVSKRTPVRNLLTGETVELDVPAFYANPPKSLLDLLPTAWVNSQSREITVKNTAGENLSYRDYNEGRPTGWNVQAWKTLFPSLKSGANVDDAFRIVQYSGSPSIAINGLTGFIF